MSNLGALASTLQAGDSWSWSETAADYPGGTPGWSLSYVLLNAAARHQLLATWDAAARAHRFETAAAASAVVPAGLYTWTELASHTDGRRQALVTGTVRILPDPLTADLVDARSHARRMLDAIRACLEQRATSGDLDLVAIASGSAGGNRSAQYDLAQLHVLHRFYTAQVAGEDAQSTGNHSGMVQVVFG